MSEAVKTSDRFLLWPLALTIGWPLAMMIVTILPFDGYMFLFPMMAISLWAPLAGFVFCLASMWLWQFSWRRFLSAIIFPLVTLIGFVYADESRLMIRTGGEFIHFGAMLPFYEWEIAKLPTDQGPRMKYFNWEGWASISFGVLYDQSDEIEKDSVEESDAWKARANSHLDCEIVGWDKLIWHFYFVELGC